MKKSIKNVVFRWLVGWFCFALPPHPCSSQTLVFALTFYRELWERPDLLKGMWLVRMKTETPCVSCYCSRCLKPKQAWLLENMTVMIPKQLDWQRHLRFKSILHSTVVHAPAYRRLWQEDCCKFEVGLGSRVRCRPQRTTVTKCLKAILLPAISEWDFGSGLLTFYNPL